LLDPLGGAVMAALVNGGVRVVGSAARWWAPYRQSARVAPVGSECDSLSFAQSLVRRGGSPMRRRECITLFGGAVGAMPVVGVISDQSRTAMAAYLEAFLKD